LNATTFEPERKGCATLNELQAFRSLAKVYSNEGLCQILFFRSNDACKIGDADHDGDDQRKQGILLP